jgi:hypothetical protein
MKVAFGINLFPGSALLSREDTGKFGDLVRMAEDYGAERSAPTIRRSSVATPSYARLSPRWPRPARASACVRPIRRIARRRAVNLAFPEVTGIAVSVGEAAREIRRRQNGSKVRAAVARGLPFA